MTELTGIKELYDVNIRLLKPLTIGDKSYDINESILSFKTAEMSQIQQSKRSTTAHGGYNDATQIVWTTDRETSFAITHGVLSPVSWALLSNSQLKEEKYKSVQYYEDVKVNSGGDYDWIDLKYCPNCCERLGAQPNPDFQPHIQGRRPELMLKPLPPSKTKWIFIYNKDSGKKITQYQIYRNRIYLQEDAKEVIIDYTFDYRNDVMTLNVGDRLIKGFLKLDAKMSVKSQVTGMVTTAILEIPRMKIDSSLSMQLGSNYTDSVVSNFYFTGLIDDNQKDKEIMKISFLRDELTGEYI